MSLELLGLAAGCFGIGAPSRQKMWLELALNVVFLLGALSVYLRSIARLQVRAHSTPAIKL